MLTRTPVNHSRFNQPAAARRRIRRAAISHPLYCRTNGCTTYMLADTARGVATCPVCGAHRTLH